MTDDVMRDLVTKHDRVISSLVSSVEHLVNSQTETNKRLEEISKFLAKQAVFSTKLANMDRELSDSFKRVHTRIDRLDEIQESDTGCNSMKLLTKDVAMVTRDVGRLVGVVDGQEMHLAELETHKQSLIDATTIRWIVGIVAMYSIIFGVYVVESINTLNNTNSQVTLLIKENTKDVNELMKERYVQHVRIKND